MNTKAVRELRSIALYKGLRGYYKLERADLVALLLEKSSEKMPTPAPPHEKVLRWLREIPDHLKMLEMGNEAVAQFSYALSYVPDHLKTEEMCIQDSLNLKYVPNDPKFLEMCERVVKNVPCA